MSVHTDAADRYAEACDRRRLLMETWEELGKPVLGEGGATGRAVVPHPLIAMMLAADRACALLAGELKAAQRGRPVGSASAVDRADVAPVRLKAAS